MLENDAILAGRNGKELTSTMSQMGYTGHHIIMFLNFQSYKEIREILYSCRMLIILQE